MFAPKKMFNYSGGRLGRLGARHWEHVMPILCPRAHPSAKMALKLAHLEAQLTVEPKQIRDLSPPHGGRPTGTTCSFPGPKRFANVFGREAILAGYTVQFATAMALVAGLAKEHGGRRLDARNCCRSQSRSS
jgi:hypothetical protein